MKTQTRISDFLLFFAVVACLCARCDAQKSGSQSWRFFKGAVSALAFSPDGQTLAIAGDQSVYLYNLRAGKRRVLFESGDVPWIVIFTPDSQRLLALDFDGLLHLLDIKSGGRVWQQPVGAFVHSLALAADGKTYAIGGGGPDNLSGITEIGRLGHKKVRRVRSESPVSAVAFSPDGKTLLAGNTNALMLIDTTSFKVQEQRAHLSFAASDFALAPKGGLFAISENKDWPEAVVLRKWSGKGWTAPLHVLKGHRVAPTKLAFSRDGSLLVSGSNAWREGNSKQLFRDNVIKIWDTATGKERRSIDLSPQRMSAFSLAPDGKTLAVGTEKGLVRLYKLD